MTPEQSALLVGFLAFLGVVSAPIVTGFLNDQQDRRQKRHDYIQKLVNDLIEIRGELQFHQKPGWEYRNLLIERQQILTQNPDDPTKVVGIDRAIYELRNSADFRIMEIAYGKAYSMMISVDISEIRAEADEVLSERNNVNPSRKLAAIDFALKNLGEQYKIFKKSEDWHTS